jgi:hypothetical protein
VSVRCKPTVSLNRRDHLTSLGKPLGTRLPLVPKSDPIHPNPPLFESIAEAPQSRTTGGAARNRRKGQTRV